MSDVKKQKLEGFAITAPTYTRHGRPTMKVLGVGLDTPTAWADAAYQCQSQRVDGMELQRRNPDYKTVPCTMNITFDLEKVL